MASKSTSAAVNDALRNYESLQARLTTYYGENQRWGYPTDLIHKSLNFSARKENSGDFTTAEALYSELITSLTREKNMDYHLNAAGSRDGVSVSITDAIDRLIYPLTKLRDKADTMVVAAAAAAATPAAAAPPVAAAAAAAAAPAASAAALPKLLESFRKARTPTSTAKPVSRTEALDSVSSMRKLLGRPVNTTPTGFVTVQKVLFTPKQRAAAAPAAAAPPVAAAAAAAPAAAPPVAAAAAAAPAAAAAIRDASALEARARGGDVVGGRKRNTRKRNTRKRNTRKRKRKTKKRKRNTRKRNTKRRN
jgi:hypothetical protein